MSPLPPAYAWIDQVIASGEAPRTLIEARKRFGIAEVPGAPDNPEILAWARELGVEADYVRDEISWCGLFAGIVVERAGWRPVERLLAARSWLRFGRPADRPIPTHRPAVFRRIPASRASRAKRPASRRGAPDTLSGSRSARRRR